MSSFRLADGGGPVIPDFGQPSACIKHNGWFCTDWMTKHWGDTLQPALIQHIQLTLIAVGIGFVISFALALMSFRWRLFDAPLGGVSDLLYAIPSLALFQLLVPLTGVTVTTVEIALVSYTLFILYRNIVAGLRGVPADVLESARGMGLTRLQTFRDVELPLAVPAILAGIRIATVATISIATVAAFLIDYGLGAPIFAAIETPDLFKTELLAAGGLAIVLALTVDLLLAGAQRALTPWNRLR
ncbi:MAG TPA: ABC transporter permease [Gaiellaceae bacterium]|jgi:osmoprotectant transport system permease protein|nr:ABC transporter permease [Gaiellaceae bacterium]